MIASHQEVECSPRWWFFRAVGIVCAIASALVVVSGLVDVLAAHEPEPILIDYPMRGSIFPPDMAAPTFLWRDPASASANWQIDVTFASGASSLHLSSTGELMQVGEIDKRCISNTNKLPELTPEQAAAHTWKPDSATWAAIKKAAGIEPISIAIRGLASDGGTVTSEGSTGISVSSDPVGAPIFYRDVPLMPSETEKGFIKPLAGSAIPLIEWRMRNVADDSSHVVMTDLHSCANCHSFAANGKTLGLDMDGPQNDKGLYAMVPIGKRMTIRNEDMISWSSFPSESSSPVRVGFMSQVSPDGRYVVTTTRPPGTSSSQFYYVSNFKDYRFLQVFYPTRGIIQWYDKTEKKLRPLPGADDPRYLQSNAVWSPDEKFLVFERAVAKDPYPADGKMAAYANDPEEVKIQYDLYRIDFNGGKGGTPVPIEGASNNAMSNSFPKISPDGKWIVYVQAKNGQLMRPDSRLWIVPATGGTPRLMHCNTPLMNSWHSFSPNGHWLVFSSKSRSPYTQMFLTHIDADGNDSPAILIENSTAANRAVNIPEFVNMDPSGIDHIDTPAVDFYKQYDVAAELAHKGQYQTAIPEWEKALIMSPTDARAHNNFGQTLVHVGKTDAAIAEFRKAIAAKPLYPEAQSNLAIALAGAGHPNEAIEHFKLAIEANPGFAEAHSNLGHLLAEQGKIPEAIEQYEQALAVNPEYAEAHNNLGFALASAERMDEAIEQYNLALKSDPKYAHAHNNLGLAFAIQGKLDDAVVEFQRAIELDSEYAAAEGNLGHALEEKNRFDDAIEHLTRALSIGPASAEVETNLGLALAEKGQVDDSIPHFQHAIALSPRMAEAHSYLGTVMVMKGDRAEARAQWHLAVQSESDNLRVLNDLSWLLATAPEPALRDGAEAVRLANHAVELTHQQDPMLLGTLAAAYAETGDFSQAVATEQRAINLAGTHGNSKLVALLQSRLALFQQHNPIRQR